MKIGYARVSTADQNLQLQLDALTKVGCEKTFTDQASGARDDRQGLQQAIEFAREGDVLVVWKLDRLGRSVRSLIELVEALQARGIGFLSITDNIDTTTSAGRFFFHVMAAMAQMERDLIRERTKAGLEAARMRGRLSGRPSVVDAKKLGAAKKLLTAGTSATEVASTLGISRATLYRALSAERADNGTP